MVTYEVYDTKKKKIVFKGNATDTADMLYIEKSTLYALACDETGRMCHKRFLVKSFGKQKRRKKYDVYDISNVPELKKVCHGTIGEISRTLGINYTSVRRAIVNNIVIKNKYKVTEAEDESK